MELRELVCTHHRYLECHWLCSDRFNLKFEQNHIYLVKKTHVTFLCRMGIVRIIHGPELEANNNKEKIL